MASRFLKAAIPQNQSVYTPLPLDFINQKLEMDQLKLDQTGATLAEKNAQPFGLQNINDENQESIALNDYNNAASWSSQFNQKVSQAVDDLYKTGDVSQAAQLIGKLNREYTQANSQEGILGKNKLRQEAYTKLHEGLAKVKHLENAKHLSLPYLREIEKMKVENDPYGNYIPDTDVAYGEYVDRAKVADDIIKGMETNQTAWADPNNRGGKYISSGTKETRTSTDIGDVYDFAMNQSGLFSDISNEIDYLAMTGKEVSYLNGEGKVVTGKITNQDQAQDYFNYKKDELKQFVQKKYTTTKLTSNLKNNDIFTTGYEYDLNNPSLPIISEHGATGTVKGQTYDEWKKSLANKEVELQTASQNTLNSGFKLIEAAGIKDKKAVDYIVTHKAEFYNPDGTLNIEAVNNVVQKYSPGKQLTNDDIVNLQSGFAFYNEAWNQEKNIERQKDNMQTRVNNIDEKFSQQYNKTDINKEFYDNKNIYTGYGINSPEELLAYSIKNPGGFLFDDQGKAYQLEGLASISNKVNKDHDKYFEENSFANSYLTIENASNTKEVGLYNKGITDHFKKDPVALLNSRVDGTSMLVRDYLKKNGISPDKISIDNISAVMISNPMLDGGTGLMISIKDGKGNKLAEVPISDDGIQSGSRDEILNRSYFSSKTNPGTSNPSNQQYRDALELSKGNLWAGKEIRAIDTKNMQPNEENTIKTTNGIPYKIKKLPIGGYSVTAYGSNGAEYNSDPNTPLADDNAILEFIGTVEFFKNAPELEK
jgi:RNA polymerase-interacting CarD/CdnL/TRCF family regulator